MAPKKAAKKEEATKEEPAAKRKAEEAKEEEPPAKEAKTEEKKEPEELEKDAPKDTRPTIKAGTAGFDTNSTSLNVIPTMNGTLLTTLNEGGLQYLIAGARANVGVKAGRYMFEAKIFEVLNPADLGQSRARPPMPRQLLRIGFSTSASALILGESEEHVYFDSEGCFYAEKKKKVLGKRFTRDQVVAVVLNVDAKSPNKNTISLFRDGERLCEPQPLPEALHGKTLFPHVSFRNVSVHVPFGSSPMKALPFSCRSVQEAAQKDVQVVETKKQDKYNVVFPVGFPDEGTFDWLDGFLAKNPEYVELSDRSIMQWANASGLWLQKGANWQNSNDRPNMNFGLPGMEDGSVRRVINNVASIVPRNYVVMEVKSNLVSAERKENLQRFSAPHFKKIARVAMGEPKADFKEAQLEVLLKEKQEKATEAWKRKKAEVERKKQIAAVKQKQQEAMKKRMEEAAAAKAAAAKAAAEKKAAEAADAKAEEGDAKKEEGEGDKMEVEKKEETKEEEKKEEAKEEEVKEEEKPAEEKEPEEEVSEEPPVAELTDEEKKVNFRPKNPSDLTEAVLNKSFGDFSIPEKAEGFDEVTFEWQNAAGSAKYLKTWVLERKKTSRVEDLKPGQWFTDTLKEWQKKFDEYQEKRKALKPSEKKEGSAEDDEVKAAVAKVDLDELKDVSDMGDGTPVYKLFAMEDWALLQLRFELFLLTQAFAKDVNDPERVGIHESHLGFYYQKYFRKTLAPKVFGLSSATEVTAMVADTVAFSDEQVLTTSAAEDATLDSLLKLAEEKRRERQRRLDAGDETARLKFQPGALSKTASGVTAPVPAAGAAAAGAAKGGLVPGKVAPESAGAGGQGKWASGGKGGKGGNRSTPYGQGAYGGGNKQQGWGGGGGGGWGRKW